jgi:hypothetical protein
MKINVLWNTTPCGLEISYDVSEDLAASIFRVISATLKMDAANSSETSVNNY